VKYEHQFENDLNLEARMGYDYATTLGTYVENVTGVPYTVVNLDNFLSHRMTGDLQVRQTFWEKHTVTAGAEILDNLEDRQRNYNVLPYYSYLNDTRHSFDYGLFLQEEYRILTNLTFNGGVRYDNFQTFGSTVNPRTALIYQPVGGTTLKVIYGTAYRAPSPYELYYSDGGDTQVPSPNLKPEKIATEEAVVEQQMGKHLSGSLSGFYNDINDLIEQTTIAPGLPNAGLIQLQNMGKATSTGLELAFKGTWTGGWEGRASYSFTEAKDGVTGAWLVNSPHHLIKFDLTAPLWREKVFATLDCQIMSDRKTLADHIDPAYGAVNFVLLGRQLIRGLEVSANIYNLFNEKYSDPGGEEHLQDLLQQNGRTFLVKATYHF